MPPPAPPAADALDDDARDADAPLTGAYRLLRRVTPPESPFPGWFAAAGDDTLLLVPGAMLDGWAGWDFPAGGHVLAPRDLVRTAAGVCVELDRCLERVDRFLDRREHAGVLLRGGEAVTLAVSVLRATAELAVRRPRGALAWPCGNWWLTDAGMPVFVHESDGPTTDAGSRALLERIAALTDAPGARAAVAATADRAAEERDEDTLFRAAEPAPLTTVVFEPARARSLASAVRDTDVEAPSRRGRVARVAERHIDADFAGLVSDATHSVLRRLRGRRAKPWMVGAGVAVAVLVGGVLWPGGGDPPATARPDSAASVTASSGPPVEPSSGPSPEPSVAPSAVGEPPPDGPGASPSAPYAPDLAAVAGGLLDERRACRDDAGCLSEVMEDPRAAWSPGAADLPADRRTVTLLDEFGGVAVVRVNPADAEAAAQLVVIVESDGRWLLRDVHDVAER